MNGHLARVYLYELRRNFRRKGYLFATFGIPIIVIALLLGYHAVTTLGQDGGAPAEAPSPGAIFGVPDNASEGRTLGFVDLSGVLDGVDDTGSLLRFPDEAAAAAALQADEIDSYYVIAADYLATGGVTLVQPTLSLGGVTERPIRELLRAALRQQIKDDALYYRLVDPTNVEQVNTQHGAAQPASAQDFDSSFVLVYVFVIALLTSLFMTNGYLLQAVVEEKESRIVEILISTVRPLLLLAGKILAYGTLGLFQILVWVAALLIVLQLGQLLASLSVLAGMFIPLDALPLVLVYFLLAYLFFAAAYGIVGALATTMREGPQYVVIFTLPAVVPLYFISLFIEAPDAALPVILSLIPITAPLAMTMRLLLTAVPAWQIALSVGLLVLAIIFMMWLAGRLFRVQVLLAGQMPRLRDLPRLVRG